MLHFKLLYSVCSHVQSKCKDFYGKVLKKMEAHYYNIETPVYAFFYDVDV